MSPQKRSNLIEYLNAFENTEEAFLFCYAFDEKNCMTKTIMSRGEFLLLARRAASVLLERGLLSGDCFALCFGANHCFDLAFRMAAVMTGTIPVTVNWQADTAGRICYKIERTGSRLILYDGFFQKDYLEMIDSRFPGLKKLSVENTKRFQELNQKNFFHDTDPETARIIVFTSGTTAAPKGVRLPYRAYKTNRAAFEQFLGIGPENTLALLAVNPMHHSNSTAITDWAMRRPNTHLHLIERYSKQYWRILSDVTRMNYDRIIAPVVSRHFDFLETLEKEKLLPIEIEIFRKAMRKIDFLIGSAPVGPGTVGKIISYTGRTPFVRFGSTETCLQVIGIPVSMDEEARLNAFEKGWRYKVNDVSKPGFFIGRPHPPYTEVRIVESVTPGEKYFMKDTETGFPGYLITRGNNLMTGYVDSGEKEGNVFCEGWYTGFKDICFALKNDDGELDYYWVSRESTLLMKGGVNYSYDQINSELKDFTAETYALSGSDFSLAVVGIKIDSEHEDSCCVTIDLKNTAAGKKKSFIEKTFIDFSGKKVSKGAKPDYVRFSAIPRNFKGAVLIKELVSEYRSWIETKNR